MTVDAGLAEQREQDHFQTVDRLVAGLPEDSFLKWSSQLAILAEFSQQVPEGQKALFIQKLLENLFGKIGSRPEVISLLLNFPPPPPDFWANHPILWYDYLGQEQEALFASLETAVNASAAVDKPATQAFLQTAYLQTHESPLRALVSHAFCFPEMAADDMAVKEDKQSGQISFDYYGRKVVIDPPLSQAVKAREVLAGLALLLEDDQSQPLALLHAHLLQSDAQNITQGEVCSLREFTQKYYYGEPVSLEEIKTYLDDDQFKQKFKSIIGDYNPHTFPLYARVRLRHMLETDNASLIEFLFQQLGMECLSLFQIFNEKDLTRVLKMVDWLAKEKPQLAQLMVRGAFNTSEFSPAFDASGQPQNSQITRLLEAKVKEQLLEAVELFEKKPESITDYDWEIIAYSQEALMGVAKSAVALSEGRTAPVLGEMQMPPRFVLDLFDFIGRHPEAKTNFQTMFDLALAIQIARQEQAPYAGQAAALKQTFYQAFGKEDRMARQAATTETSTDIARAKSLVLYEKKLGRLPEKPRALFMGCGNCQRFEAPLIRQLKEEGIGFADILGVDLIDFSSHIPADLEMRFKQGNVVSTDFFKEEGQFDLVFIPWSMINDVIEKKDLLAVLQKFKRLIKPDGLMIFDIPLPIGRNSYAETIENQADVWGIWGLLERDFDNDENLRSIFDIMHIREMFMHLVHAGFIPTSPHFPLQFDKQHQLCQAISADDSKLTANHESKADEDAVEHPFWQAKGYNRATLAVRNVGVEEVQNLTGLAASFLVSRGFTG